MANAKTKKLTQFERTTVEQFISRMAQAVYDDPVQAMARDTDLGDRVYRALVAPYVSAMERLPAMALPIITELDCLCADMQDENGNRMRTRLKLSAPSPWFNNGAHDPWFLSMSYNRERIELSSIFMSAHPELAEELTAYTYDVHNKIMLRRKIQWAIKFILDRCTTSGQLLTMLPQIRDYLPRNLQDHTPTTRGIRKIKDAMKENTDLPFDRIASTFAAYRLMGH